MGWTNTQKGGGEPQIFSSAAAERGTDSCRIPLHCYVTSAFLASQALRSFSHPLLSRWSFSWITFNISPSAWGFTKLLPGTVSSPHGKCVVSFHQQSGRSDALPVLSIHCTTHLMPCQGAHVPFPTLDESPLGFILEDNIIKGEVLKKRRRKGGKFCTPPCLESLQNCLHFLIYLTVDITYA